MFKLHVSKPNVSSIEGESPVTRTFFFFVSSFGDSNVSRLALVGLAIENKLAILLPLSAKNLPNSCPASSREIQTTVEE